MRMRKKSARSYQLLYQLLYQPSASCSLHPASVGRIRPSIYLLRAPCQASQVPLGDLIPFFISPAIIMARFCRWTTALHLFVIVTAIDTNAVDAVSDISDANGRLNSSAIEYGLQWQAWKTSHRRSYVTLVEELERFVIWRSNQAFIDYHNSYADKLGFTLRMNQFGDLVRDAIQFCWIGRNIADMKCT